MAGTLSRDGGILAHGVRKEEHQKTDSVQIGNNCDAQIKKS